MRKRNFLLSGFLFLLLFILTELFFPEVFSNKILSYLITGLGFIFWLYSFKVKNSAGIFSGSLIFFSGIILFVSSSFIIWNPSRMIFPALLISIGLASFLTFSADKKIYYLIFAAIFSLLGFNFLHARMSFKFTVFLDAVSDLILSVGIFTAIALIIFFFIFKKKSQESGKENERNDYEKKTDF